MVCDFGRFDCNANFISIELEWQEYNNELFFKLNVLNTKLVLIIENSSSIVS
jgi:putative cell wall-binding protein